MPPDRFGLAAFVLSRLIDLDCLILRRALSPLAHVHIVTLAVAGINLARAADAVRRGRLLQPVADPAGGARNGEHGREHAGWRSEEHTSELQSRGHLVCRLLLVKKIMILLF